MYRIYIDWTGNKGTGTSSPMAYSRAHCITAARKPPIKGSADPSFRGDPARWNPEELLLASIAACHQLWYLGLCAQAGIVVTAYTDSPEAVMEENPDGSGQFTQVILHPQVTLVPGADKAMAEALHHTANAMCFIARSVNFPIQHHPVTVEDEWCSRRDAQHPG